jgi:hypothetical protein
VGAVASPEAGKDGPEETENWSARCEVPEWMNDDRRVSKWLRVIRELPGGAEAEAKRAIGAGDIVCVVASAPSSWQLAGATRLLVDVEERSAARAQMFEPVTIRLARAAGS